MSNDLIEIYEALINKNLYTEDQLEKEINRRYNLFKGHLSKEAILQIVGSENGIGLFPKSAGNLSLDIEDYDEFTIDVADIQEDTESIVLCGIIEEDYGFHDFRREDGSEGYVGSFQLFDGTGSIRVTLWDAQVKNMINEAFKEGEYIRIIGAYLKMGIDEQLEVHLSKRGKIILAPDNISNKRIELIEMYKPKKKKMKIAHISLNDRHISIEGFIKAIYPQRSFNRKDGSSGQVQNIIIEDESGEIGINLWDDIIQNLSNFYVEDKVKISNLRPKFNNFRNAIELNFSKQSRIDLIFRRENNAPQKYTIKSLYDRSGYVNVKISGSILEIGEFKELDTKNGKSFLLKFILTDDTASIMVNVWGMKAIEIVPQINQFDSIEMSNFSVNISNYSQEKEVSTTKYTDFKIISSNS